MRLLTRIIATRIATNPPTAPTIIGIIVVSSRTLTDFAIVSFSFPFPFRIANSVLLNGIVCEVSIMDAFAELPDAVGLTEDV